MQRKNLNSNLDPNNNNEKKSEQPTQPTFGRCFKPKSAPTPDPEKEAYNAWVRSKENKGPLQYDPARKMYYFGNSLSESPPSPIQHQSEEKKDKEGNVIGIAYRLGGKE